MSRGSSGHTRFRNHHCAAPSTPDNTSISGALSMIARTAGEPKYSKAPRPTATAARNPRGIHLPTASDGSTGSFGISPVMLSR